MHSWVDNYVYSLTSAERGKTHTILACVSASGNSLPPLMIFPRKRSLPDSHRKGAVSGTMFMVSDKGWMIILNGFISFYRGFHRRDQFYLYKMDMPLMYL